MIAATAIEHGFTVVTRNMPDLINTGVQLLNPWPHTFAGKMRAPRTRQPPDPQ